ncbi:MAG: alpha-glucosidase/alpha-galactosidase, partial [Planctomycetes bacterium]|nr:alpha-glucosidase/alpha-galactosidase [Planctomycetota bacterium]
MTRKITFIGSSFLFVPSTMRDILLNGNLDDSEVMLYDINPDAIKVVYDLCARMIQQCSSNIKLSVAKTRRAALQGADFVVASVLAGGLDVVQQEEKICRTYGSKHTVGDTIGPMCTARILRQVSLMLDIAKDMEKI